MSSDKNKKQQPSRSKQCERCGNTRRYKDSELCFNCKKLINCKRCRYCFGIIPMDSEWDMCNDTKCIGLNAKENMDRKFCANEVAWSERDKNESKNKNDFNAYDLHRRREENAKKRLTRFQTPIVRDDIGKYETEKSLRVVLEEMDNESDCFGRNNKHSPQFEQIPVKMDSGLYGNFLKRL